METLVREAVTYVLIALELVLGFFTWLLVLALLPGDGLDFNVLGSVVMIVLCSTPYAAVHFALKGRLEPQS